MVLTSFPRGGKKPEVKKSSYNGLFGEKKPKKKYKTHTKKKTDDDIVEIINSTAERLSNATVREGMTILGRISEISEYNLIVSIPGGLLGRIEIANLSESYTNLLQNIIDTKSIQSNEFKPLPDLYNLGDYVVCYVKKINLNEQWSYSLSLEPQLINQNIHNSYLVKGAKMVCTVKSREDHGYVMETGIANVRAFIATENVDKGKQYFPGNQLFCAIKEIKTTDHTSVVILSAKRKKSDSISRHDIVSLDALTPGTKLTLCIRKVLPNGLQVVFGRNNIGYINQIYLDNPLSAYTDSMEVIGTLLYILPTVKLAYFSLLTDTSEKEKLKEGDIIKKAKVLYRESNGIIFELSKSGLHGFISLRRTDVPFAKISTEFKQSSIHKCRVLSYNWMEHLYVCTMEQEILKQKYFSISDLDFGDILIVTISSIDTNYGCVHVQAGKIKGIVLREHVSDSGLNALSKLKIGDNIEARVLDISSDKFQKIKFTLKQSLIKSELPVLHDIHEAQCGSKYHGTIVKMNKNGLLIKFYGDVKGWIPRNSFDSYAYDVNWNYSIGQTITVCIESVEEDKGKMKLKIVTNEEKEKSVGFSIGKLIEGTITESSIEGIHLTLCENKEHTITAFLPASHMAPCMEIGSLLASKSNPEDIISAFVFATKPSLILSRTFVTQEQYRNFDSLKIGDCIPCTIRDISQDGVRVILPIENYSKFGFVPYKNISNFELLHVNQILFVKITAVNTQEKQLTLTMTLKDIWESSSEYEVKIMSAVDLLHLYLTKLSELAKNTFYQNKPISLATLGQKVTGTVEKITKHGLVVQLDNQLTGTVCKDHYSGKIKVGDKVSGVILWKNYIHELVDVSLLPRIVNSISSKQKTLPQLPTEVVLKAEILIITKWFILVLIKRNGTGYLATLPVRRHANDISPDLTPYVIHDKIRLYVIMTGSESDMVPICMLKSALEMRKCVRVKKSTSANKKLKRKNESDQHNAPLKDPAPKKLKTESHTENAANESDVTDKKGLSGIKTNNVTNKNKKIEKELNEKPFDEVNSKYDAKRKRSKEENETWENQDTAIEEENRIKDIDENSELDEGSSDESEIENKLTEDKLHITECGFSWEGKTNPTVLAHFETSSDDEEKSEEEPKRKKKKLNAAERWEQERQKEREIRQREEALTSNQMPNSIDQFDRLVLSSPDNSLVWVQYMAYHLQATEIDKARAVAERAIKTINFREETERLNIWNAWLNLESRFGTSKSLNDVFQEAVRTNDALKVYTHMLNVHTDAIELQKLIGTMTNKFKQEPQMWIDCGAALLKIGLKEKSRHIMQRALQSLPASQHINLIARFANLENKLGDKERAQTLFEQILSSYPKRVDVWSCYVNCLTKSGDIDKARKVLERACVQTLPARKMKALFNKFKSFEEKYGTPEAVSHVVQMAAAYVEKQCSKE